MNDNKKIIAVFDFDGTITKKDSMMALIRYAFGAKRLSRWVALNIPWLVLMKLGLMPSVTVKERLLSYFLCGMHYDCFERICDGFFKTIGREILRDDALECIRRHKANGDYTIIASASADVWVKPFADCLGIDRLISSRLEVSSDGKLTGKLIGENCKGREKVARLKEIFPERTDYVIEAYGDSSGDKELLQFADVSHYKVFKN